MANLQFVRWATWLTMASMVMAQFNSTVNFTVTSIDPMLGYDYMSDSILDPETGYRTSDGRSSDLVSAWFVGTAFDVQGRAFWKRDGPLGGGDRRPGLATIQPMNRVISSPETLKFNLSVKDTPDLVSSSLNLSAYELQVSWRADAKFEFHNLTVEIPVRTQAPSLELLKQQTTYTPAVQDGGLNPAMTVTQGTSNYQELIGMFQQRMETGSSGPQWEGNDSKVIISWKTIGDMVYLRNLTELSYQLPSNTTLVEVLGPVGRNNMTSYGSQCYAALDPRPIWWRNGSFPLAAGEKAVNATNRTMFLLPVDPAVRSTLKVGTLGWDASCFISGVKTYPFHYNYTLANMMASSANESNENGGGSNKTGIIVGVVVGVSVPLLLAALAAWYFVRKRKQRQEKESQPQVQPYVVNEKELARFYSAELNADNETAAGAAGSGDGGVTGSSDDENRPPNRRIVQEEDGGEVEYLPPRYLEAWQLGPSEGASTPGESAPEASDLSPPEENGTGQRRLPAIPAPSPPLKEEYLLTSAQPGPSSSDLRTSPSPAPNAFSSSKDGGAVSPPPRDVKSPMGPRSPREPTPPALGPTARSPAAGPAELPTALEGDYKRAFN